VVPAPPPLRRGAAERAADRARRPRPAAAPQG
jgi:hypothetical protein